MGAFNATICIIFALHLLIDDTEDLLRLYHIQYADIVHSLPRDGVEWVLEVMKL